MEKERSRLVTLLEHIQSLAKGARVRIVEKLPHSFQLMDLDSAYHHLVPPIIHINRPLVDPLANETYWVLLHELGHANDPNIDSHSTLRAEIYAWEWALNNTLVWTADAHAFMSYSLGTYFTAPVLLLPNPEIDKPGASRLRDKVLIMSLELSLR